MKNGCLLQKYGPPAAKELTASGDKFEISYLSYNWRPNDQGEHGRHYSKINLLFDNIFQIVVASLRSADRSGS